LFVGNWDKLKVIMEDLGMNKKSIEHSPTYAYEKAFTEEKSQRATKVER
jgi:hypothetical protein